MLDKNLEFIYYLISHNGGQPKDFDELYFDYIDRCNSDKDLNESLNKLIQMKKIQKVYFNPQTHSCHKIKINDDERLGYLPQDKKNHLKQILSF